MLPIRSIQQSITSPWLNWRHAFGCSRHEYVARFQGVSFDSNGVESEFINRPYHGRTLSVRDPIGIPLEFYATMPVQSRLHDQFQLQKGAAGLRYDHVQVLAPNVLKASRFYLDLGFRISDYFVEGRRHFPRSEFSCIARTIPMMLFF